MTPLGPAVAIREMFCNVKSAVADLLEFIVTEQVPMPEQAPLQPLKLDPADGVAVRTTDVRELKLAAHSGPQVIPAGLLVTIPLPAPVFVTVNG